MQYTTLGDTGLEVSRICLGCMSFGTGKYGWGLDGPESTGIIEEPYEAVPVSGHE